MMYRIRTAILAALLVTSAAGTSATQPAATDRSAAPAITRVAPGNQGTSGVRLRQQPSFWDDSMKAIKDGGWDVGSWLEYRRRLLVEASVTNRYFWFCITSFFANVLLLYLFYASRVSEDRKLWKATAAMTELWNWALFADWSARKAIHKFNSHIEQCSSNRTDRHTSVEISKSTKADIGDLNRTREERDALQQQVLALRSEIGERESVITSLNRRIDEVAKTVSAGADPKLTAQLMEKVNMLSLRNQYLEQQLASAQNKLVQPANGAN